MNKALFLMLAASVSLNVYLVNVEVVVKDDLDQEYIERPSRDHISIAQAAVEKDDKSESREKAECSPKVVEKIIYKEREPEPTSRARSNSLREITENDLDSISKDKMQELAQAHLEDWDKKSKNFFEYRLGLSPSQQNDYERLKVEMEGEISSMLQQNTPQGESLEGRMISSEEMMRMGRIHKKYADKLKNAFGPSAYEEYISFREGYNRELARSSRGAFGVNF